MEEPKKNGNPLAGYEAILAQGICIERSCMNDTRRVCDAFRTIRESLKKMGELAECIGLAWEQVRENRDVNASGNLKADVSARCVEPVRAFAELLPPMARLFAVDENEALGPYRRNIADMTELKDALDLRQKIELKIGECNRAEPARRKALWRELRRMYRQLAASCPSILHGRYASPNVDPVLSETIFGYVRALVDDAKERAAELKACC